MSWDTGLVGVVYALNLPMALKILAQPELLTPFLIAHFTTPGFYFTMLMLFSTSWRKFYLRNR